MPLPAWTGCSPRPAVRSKRRRATNALHTPLYRYAPEAGIKRMLDSAVTVLSPVARHNCALQATLRRKMLALLVKFLPSITVVDQLVPHRWPPTFARLD